MLKLKWVAAVLLLLTASVPAGAQEAAVDVKELMAAGPLAEMTLGDPAAPVTVVEYASLTCPHCARFHTEVLPEFKKKYIETGKVYFVFREFPLDQLSLAAFMLARCAAPGGYFPMVELLFTRQQEWAFVENPAPALMKLVAEKGFDDGRVKACLGDQKLFDEIREVRTRGAEKFGVEGTPAFFVNGQKHAGGPTLEEFDAILAPLLKS